MSDPGARAPTASEQQELTRRILASDLFSKSHRLSAFLRYIVEQHACGQHSAIHEQRIGMEVFGRPAGYHVGDDSIVRSQARFLRQRLEEYFATQGREETVVLSIPKGSYVPLFERRAIAEPAMPVVSAVSQAGSAAPVAAAAGGVGPGAGRQLGLYRLLLALALVVIAVLSVLLLRTESRQTGPGQPPVVRAFWGSIFNSTRNTLIVPADSTLVLLEELTGKPVRLPTYIDRDYLNEKPVQAGDFRDLLAGSQYTSTADLNLVARLQQIPQVMQTRPAIRYARDLSLKDLQESNAVLIGGLRANPWMELFATPASFSVDYDVATRHNVVHNQDPGPGEQSLYVEGAPGAEAARAYGVVIYLPSLDGLGHSLLVEGTSKAGTEAAAEFLSSPGFAAFLRRIGATAKAVPNFEVLLSTQILDGASYQPAVVCWRVLRRKTAI